MTLPEPDWLFLEKQNIIHPVGTPTSDPRSWYPLSVALALLSPVELIKAATATVIHYKEQEQPFELSEQERKDRIFQVATLEYYLQHKEDYATRENKFSSQEVEHFIKIIGDLREMKEKESIKRLLQQESGKRRSEASPEPTKPTETVSNQSSSAAAKSAHQQNIEELQQSLINRHIAKSRNADLLPGLVQPSIGAATSFGESKSSAPSLTSPSVANESRQQQQQQHQVQTQEATLSNSTSSSVSNTNSQNKNKKIFIRKPSTVTIVTPS